MPFSVIYYSRIIMFNCPLSSIWIVATIHFEKLLVSLVRLCRNSANVLEIATIIFRAGTILQGIYVQDHRCNVYSRVRTFNELEAATDIYENAYIF